MTYRKSPRIIARLKRTFNKLEKAFIKVIRERIKRIAENFLKKASVVISSGDLTKVKDLNFDLSQTDFKSIIYNYLVECRRAGRQTGITEALELKQRAEKLQGRKKKLESNFTDIVDEFIDSLVIQLNPSNKYLASNFSVVPHNALRFYEDYSLYLTGDIEKALLNKAKQKIYSGIQNGFSHQDIMEDLSSVFTDFADNRLMNISRTETSKAVNQGRVESFKAPELDGFVIAVEFSAILDSRVSDICEERDGLIMAIDDPRLPANTPPLHFQCRSVLVPVDRYSAIEEGLLEKIGEGWKGITSPMAGFGG